ncbi:glycosyltransferase 87 family protein [Kitasatospora sp. NPDC059646]|uniref:glycosyltransferase 87 family protein n=1 Tax=Kitasatospora sp. NPDC059646 TaxID=3346893 RepID=UPI00368F839D
MPTTQTGQESSTGSRQHGGDLAVEGTRTFSPWRVTTWNQRLLAPVGYWACTRLLIMMMVFTTGENAHGEVHLLYRKWAHQLQDGSFPVGDSTWQYPPGAGAVILAPTLVPGVNYVQAFILVTFVADAVILGALLRAGSRPGRSLAGAWVWVLMLPLMQYIPYARYDIIVTLFAVLALVLLPRHRAIGGALAAIGAAVKVWPAFAIFGMPWGRGLRNAVIGFVASAVGLIGIMSLLFSNGFGFLEEQSGRGVEFESLGGSALLAARHFGWDGTVVYQYGSNEVVGPYVGVIGKVLVGLSVAGFCWLLLWRVRARVFSTATPADAALAAVLVFVTTSRVISPQYFIWLAGLGAVCVTFRRSSQRVVVGLLVVATALTTVEFPFFYEKILQGHAGFTAVLLLRNLVLVVATVMSCVQLWRSTVPRGEAARGASRVPAGTAPGTDG